MAKQTRERTSKRKTEEYLEKGRTLKQMICVAVARGDKDWQEYLEKKVDPFC